MADGTTAGCVVVRLECVNINRGGNSISIGALSVFAAYTQLWGYGIGFMKEGLKELVSPTREVMREMLRKKKESAGE